MLGDCGDVDAIFYGYHSTLLRASHPYMEVEAIVSTVECLKSGSVRILE